MNQKRYTSKSPAHVRWISTFVLTCLLLLSGLYSNTSNAQCTNGAAFGSATLSAVVSGTATIVCNYAGEYGTWNSAVTGNTYNFTSTIGTDFITIHTGSPGGPVAAFGTQPLSWTSTVTGTIYVHVNTDAACGTANVCRDITGTTTALAPISVLTPFTGSNSITCGTNKTLCTHAGCGVTYSPNADGFTVINAANSAVVNINGTYSTESGFDFVTIYTGSGTGGPIAFGPVSGVGTINFTGTPGQTYSVRFQSDGSVESTGYNLAITYTGSCLPPVTLVPFSGSNSILCGSNQTLCSHAGCGINYSANANGYTVLNGSGLATINVNGSYTTESGFDFITIYDGSGTGGAILVGPVSGTGTINYTGLPGQTLTLQFTSDGSVQATGFSFVITYTGSCAAPPTVDNTFSPNTACVSPATTVNITGTGFTGASAVTFNGVNAASFIVNSATSITAVTPAGVTTGNICVTTGAGTGCSTTPFTAIANPAPVITGTSTICAGGNTTLDAGVFPSNVWDAGSLTFTETVVGQSDIITGSTTLTRVNVLFNSACQTNPGGPGCSYTGPCNTQWAVGTIANWATLTYSNFYVANGCNPVAGLPKTYVCHLIAENIYFQVTFNSWQAGGPGMSYTRTTAPSTYLWSTGATTQTVSVNTAGTYTVTVTNANGCTGSATKVVVVNPLPTVTASATPSTVPCNTSFQLNATPPPACIPNYNLSAIPFAPVTGTPTLGPTGDDFVSAPINIGFNFPFYCNTKTQLVISTNGFISFDLASGNGCCSGQNLPSGASPNDLIALCWTDLFVSTGSTDYFNLTSPNRFVIRFNGVQHCCSGPAQVDGQIILYEDGTIEIHNTAITLNGIMTQGIENAAGTAAVVVPGRNATGWTATADAYRFTPQVTTTFSWSPTLNMTGSTTANPTVSSISANTTYTVTATNEFGCTATATAAVTFNAVVANCNGTNNICFGGSTGSASVTASGGTPGYTYLWNNGNTNSSMSGLTAGTYCVTVTDATGCTGTCCYTVTEPTAVTATAVATDASCPLCPDGTVSISSVSGGTPGYSYTNLTGLLPGNYCITVTDTNGCTTSACATVGAAGCTLNANASQTTEPSCFGGSNGTATSSPSGGIIGPFAYSWSNGQTTATATGLSAGNYSVVVTDQGSGCVASGTVTITQPTDVTVSCSGTNATCNGGSDGTASVSAAGGTSPYGYLWSNAQTTATAVSLTAGVYTVVVTDANGCTKTCSYTVLQPSPVVATCSGSVVTVCATNTNGSASVVGSGGTPGYTYLWDNGATTSTITGLGVGNYCVTVTDANGCTGTCCYTVTSSAAPITVASAVTQICSVGGSGAIDITVSGGNPGGNLTYNFNGSTQGWTTGIAGNLCFTGASLPSTWTSQAWGFTGQSYGTTSVGGEHTYIMSPVIPLPANLTVSAMSYSNNEPGFSYPSCTGYDVEYVEYSTDGGTTWTPFFTTNQANLHGSNMSVWNLLSYTATITPTANGRIRFRYDNGDGCCGGSGVNNGWYIDDVTIAQPAGYSYSWSNGATTQDITGVPTGVYTVMVTDANGCTSTASYTIVNSAMTLSSTHANIPCAGANTGSIDLTVAGGQAPYTYAWTGGGTTEDLSGLAPGTYTVTVTESLVSCTATLSVTILSTPLSLTETHDDANCAGSADGSIDITLSDGLGPFSYSWSDGATTEDRTGLAAGTYTVAVTDACPATAFMVVTIVEPTPVTASCSVIANVLCYGAATGSVSVIGGGGTPPYTISPATTGLAAGTYTFTVTDANGCTGTCAVTITQPAQISPNATAVSATCATSGNGSATSSPTGGNGVYTYLWNTGSTDASITGLNAGNYTVTVKDGNNCTVSQTVTITSLNSVPPQPGAVTGPVSVCLNSTGNIFSIAAVPTATSYNWTVAAGGTITAGQGTTSITVSFGAAAVSGNVSVAAVNVCGSSILRFRAYKVIPALAAPGAITGQTSGLCRKANVPYSISPVSGATSYLWTVPGGAVIVSGQGTTSILVTYGTAFIGSGLVTVKSVNSCTMSAASNLTVNALPAKPTIIGSNTTCINAVGVPYSIAPILGATSYTWTVVPGSTITSGQGTTAIVVNWGSINGVIKVKGNNACGSGLQGTLAVSFTCKESGDNFDISEVSLYPNPANTMATLDFDSYIDGKAKVEVMDVIGKMVMTEEFAVTEGNNKHNLDVTILAKGSYLVKVNCEGSTRFIKMSVQ